MLEGHILIDSLDDALLRVPTVLRYIVLGLLRDGDPRHGYAVMKAHRARGGPPVSTGNFYRELQRLAADGLVRSAARSEGADARQTPYVISPSGIALFDRWFADTNARTRSDLFDEQLSARLLFLGDVEPDVAGAVLERWQDDLWLRAKTLERAREAALGVGAEPGSTWFQCLPVLLGRRLRHLAADLGFVEELRAAYALWLAEPSGRRTAAGHTGKPPDREDSTDRPPARTGAPAQAVAKPHRQ